MITRPSPAAFPPVAAPLPPHGMECAVMPQARGAHVAVTVLPLPGEGVAELFGRLAVTLRDLEATLVHLLVFGRTSVITAGTRALEQNLGPADWPVTWVEGPACDGSPIAGLQAFALAGGEVHRLHLDGRVIGSVFEDGDFRHCLLGGLGPKQNVASNAMQARQTLDRLGKALAQGGFSLADLTRTWFYLDDILTWYDIFNRTRTQVYAGVKFRTGSLPASTGIGGRNPGANALVAGAWAVQSVNPLAGMEEIASPLQCPAPAYGSSFSRGMEISSPAGRRLFVSGTASIAPDGRTLWPGDARRQVEQTMEVVEAILKSRKLLWSDVIRATAYFKHPNDAGLLGEWSRRHNGSFPKTILAQCHVCRDDLLFELELDAWRAS